MLELEEQESRKMEALGRLTGGLAHNFNNLLTVMLGNVEILLDCDRPDTGTLSPAQLGFLQQIRDAGERAAGLTRQLLAFSCKQPQDLQLRELKDTVEQMSELLDGDPVTVRDSAKFQQIILNLALKAVVQAGGTIRVSSSPGSKPRASIHGSGQTILVCEDEPMVRDLIREILEGAGYRVLTASDGREGLKVAARTKGGIDMLLTDVIMPQLSGTDLAQQIREKYPDVRVLFISGYTDDSLEGHDVLSRETPLLQKPFDRDSLLAEVDDLLRRGGTRQSSAIRLSRTS